VLRADFGARRPDASTVVRGVVVVSRHARWIPGSMVRSALVYGVAGAVISVAGRPFAVMVFTVVDGRIVEIDAIAGSGPGPHDRRRSPMTFAAVPGLISSHHHEQGTRGVAP